MLRRRSRRFFSALLAAALMVEWEDADTEAVVVVIRSVMELYSYAIHDYHIVRDYVHVVDAFNDVAVAILLVLAAELFFCC